jgi:hypothetical protein
MRVITKIKETTKVRSAIKIQRNWRKYIKKLKLKREADANRRALKKDFATKVIISILVV